jgi:hypothetical protein
MFEVSYYKIFMNFLLLGFDKKKIMYQEFESSVLRSSNRGKVIALQISNHTDRSQHEIHMGLINIVLSNTKLQLSSITDKNQFS